MSQRSQSRNEHKRSVDKHVFDASLFKPFISLHYIWYISHNEIATYQHALHYSLPGSPGVVIAAASLGLGLYCHATPNFLPNSAMQPLHEARTWKLQTRNGCKQWK